MVKKQTELLRPHQVLRVDESKNWAALYQASVPQRLRPPSEATLPVMEDPLGEDEYLQNVRAQVTAGAYPVQDLSASLRRRKHEFLDEALATELEVSVELGRILTEPDLLPPAVFFSGFHATPDQFTIRNLIATHYHGDD